MISASSVAVSGLHSAGLCTTVQPAASAGAIFHVDSMNGVFHGVMMPTGPIGWRMRVVDVVAVGQRQAVAGPGRAIGEEPEILRARAARPCS